MISKQKSQLLVKQSEAMLRAGALGKGRPGWSPGLGVGAAMHPSPPGPWRGEAVRSPTPRADLRAPEMTALAKGQVAAQTHSQAMRQLR